VDNWTGQSWDWQGQVVARSEATGELKVSTAPESTGTVTFPLVPSDENTVHGFTRFTIAHDSDVLLPKPDALPGNQSTFEMISSRPVLVSVAPPQALIKRQTSNSQEYKQAWQPINLARPLSIREGEQTTFFATVGNLQDEELQVALAAKGRNVNVKGLPSSITVPAHGFTTLQLEVIGGDPGDGRIEMTAIDSSGSETVGALDLRVGGSSLAEEEVPNVQSVRMIFDSWYSPGVAGAPILLNGAPVGELPANGGYATWTVRLPYALNENALPELQATNRIEIDTRDRNFKMRNVLLELTLDGGRVIELAAAEDRPQSVPPDWPAAEGIRLENGRPMVWVFPGE
jgi:hypothetical protein